MSLPHIHGPQPQLSPARAQSLASSAEFPVGRAPLGLDKNAKKDEGKKEGALFGATSPCPDDIRVEGGALPDAALHWPRLQEAQAHARKALHHLPNLSGRHYGALVVLDDGQEGMGTNLEAGRQVTLCDLRLAISTALNQSVAAHGDCLPGDKNPRLPKIKTIYLVNAEPDGEPPVPCADCQEWLNSVFCTPDTQVVSLERDAQGQDLIRLRTVGEMLPLHQGREAVRMTTDQPVKTLFDTTVYSESAVQVLRQGSAAQQAALQRRLKRMLNKAQKAYQRNVTAQDSHKRTGVSVLVSPLNLVLSGGRFDWTTRWFEAADLKTAALAFQWTQWVQNLVRGLPEVLRKPLDSFLSGPKIQAVAYYGDDSQLPPIASLGRIARRRGSSEALVLTVENDQVHVRTVADFMPEMYQTHTRA